MQPKAKARATLTVVIVLLSAFAGMAIYYSFTANNKKESELQSQIANQNAETAGLNSEISTLKKQLANLTGVVANLTSANLVTSLETHEMQGSNSSYMGGLVPTPVPFNYLWIQGSVTNTGNGYAVNAGLQVIAYTADGTLEVNLTVPFTGTTFGTDNATDTFVSKTYDSFSLTLQILDGGQATNVGINIFHEGEVSTWTITPVCWSYSPDNVVTNLNGTLISQVAYLQNQIANLNTMIKNLSTANLVAALNTKEYPATTQYGVSFKNSLFIVGLVNNIGEGVAYNAGLRVVGYTANSILEMNMTIAVQGGTYTYDSEDYTAPAKLPTVNSGYSFDSYSNSNSVSIGMTIYSQDFVSNYTVTPVWTNTP